MRNDQIAVSNGSTRRSADADTRLASTASQLPTPAREIVEGLTGVAAKLAKPALQANAAAAVKGAVGQSCSAVARSYPFDRRASQNAFPADFAQVFGPQGTLKTAFDSIASSVDMSRDPWQPRPGPDGAAAGSPGDLRAFKQAAEIRDVFFAGRSTPGFELDVRVIAPPGEKAELDVDGTVVSSADDSKRITWPGPKNSEKVRLSVGGRPPAITTDGFWALYRLIDRGTVVPASSPTVVTVALNVEGKEIRVELRARSFRHPLTMAAMQRFTCPGGR